jgi:hypothetical protein
MKQIIKFPNTILREKMVDFDFENPPMDPKQLEKIKNELIVISQQLRGELHASERAAMAIISSLEAEFETKP